MYIVFMDMFHTLFTILHKYTYTLEQPFFLILLGAVAETFKKLDFLSNFLGETVVLLTWGVVRGCAGLRGQYFQIQYVLDNT